MPCFLCTTCGTQFAESESEPEACPICQDERQYVGPGGQRWTTLDRLRRERRQSIHRVEEDLIGIGIEPSFGIGQRALLVRTPKGNVLWDCVALLDEALIQMIRGLGGVSAIAISHPHYYTTMVEWARAFDCPIHLHAADAKWVMRPDLSIRFWQEETQELLPGLTLIRCGGHFAGGTVLHWREGASGRGALLSGDILQVAVDRRWVSFMYSYPNYIPLSAAAVRRIVAAVEPFAFDRIHGAFWDWTVAADAKAAVRRSAERYVRAIESGLE
jgi:glyoxylase-like metal-dependent hydrolase (beta-lactamase superfamily II)